MTKKEVYDNQYHHSPQTEREKALKAMDKWALGFANWLKTEGWQNRNGIDWCRYVTIYSDISVKTTEELYKLFLKSKEECH